MVERATITVLLVDDSEGDHGIIRRYLGRAMTGSFEVRWAQTVEEALSLLGREAADVCLVDYRLGSHSGLEVLRSIQERDIRVPVIFLTGLGDLEVALEAMRRGAIDYLDKNELTPNLLERSIRYAIENFAVCEALRRANEELEERVRERTADLERSNRELEDFATLVSHELELPLKTITAQLDALRGSPAEAAPAGDPDLTAYFLNRAYTSAVRMQRLVREVLDYSRVGKRPSAFQPVNLEELLHEVLTELDGAIREANACVEFGPLHTVVGDPCLLERVFKNLIHNAIKYSGDAPRVYVWAEPGEQGWLCGVKDDGRGIAPDECDQIFQIFHRARREGAAPGHGIGLALCKRITQYHGGDIWVESLPGSGATFFFTLARPGGALEQASMWRTLGEEPGSEGAGE